MTALVADSSPAHVRVFNDSVRWFIRPHNTDWRYARDVIPQLSRFESEIEIYSQKSWGIVAAENHCYLSRNVRRRMGLEVQDNDSSYLDSTELRLANCDVVFSHRGFPRNAAPHPVVWQSSVLHPEMTAYYYPQSNIQQEIDRKGPLFLRSTIIHVSTEAEVRRLNKTFPESAGRFFCTPFFLPSMAAANPEILAKHGERGEIRILFVGDQAKRKGLDVLFEAYRSLPGAVRSRAKLLVVSRLTDGQMTVPQEPGIEIHRGLPHSDVIKAMRAAHILAVPSRFESYGLVYLEAMSQGTVPIAPDWEVQREILDGGAAGSLVEPGSARALRLSLEHLIEHHDDRARLAESSYGRFTSTYAPGHVARRFLTMFQKARDEG